MCQKWSGSLIRLMWIAPCQILISLLEIQSRGFCAMRRSRTGARSKRAPSWKAEQAKRVWKLISEAISKRCHLPDLNCPWPFPARRKRNTQVFLSFFCWSVRCTGQNGPVCCHIPAVGVSVWEYTGRWIQNCKGLRRSISRFRYDSSVTHPAKWQ